MTEQPAKMPTKNKRQKRPGKASKIPVQNYLSLAHD